MTERKVKKNKREEDTCRDCWRTRFRKDLIDIIPEGIDPSTFFSAELSLREELYDEYRVQARDIYEEMGEIRALAGDVFMKRYPEKEEKH